MLGTQCTYIDRNDTKIIHYQPLLNQIQGDQKFCSKKNLIIQSANIQLYYNKIGKSAQNSGVFDGNLDFL